MAMPSQRVSFPETYGISVPKERLLPNLTGLAGD